MSEPGNVVITQRCDKYLCLVLQAAECLAMDNAIAVALKLRPHWTRFLIMLPAP